MSKRQHRRHNIDHPAIAILQDGIKVDCRIRNFSHGGIFLIENNNKETNERIQNIPLGTAAAIQVLTQRGSKGSSIIVQTTVAHSSGNGLGIAFVSQEPELLDYLQRLLATDNLQQYKEHTTHKQNKMGPQEVSIVNSIHSSTKRFLEARYAEFIRSSYDDLFEEANNAGSNQTHNTLFDDYNLVKRKQDEVRNLFLDNVSSSFNRFSSGSYSYNKSSESQSQHPEMELVAKEDFEEWVSVVSLTRNLELEIASKLHKLENSLSFLAKTYINNETNPVSPYSLLWSFKKSFSNIDITLPAKRVLFTSFQNNMLKDIASLYDEINLHLKQQGITQQAHEEISKQPQKPVPAHTVKKITDNLSSLINYVSNKPTTNNQTFRPEQIAPREMVVKSLANISAAGRRPIIQKIEEQLSSEMINSSPTVVDNQTRNAIQVTEQILGVLQQDASINPEAQRLIDSLKIPFIKEAINDPALLNDADHPGHRLLETIGKLSPYLPTDEKNKSGKGYLYQTLEEISRLAEQGAQLDIKEITNHLEQLIDHQKSSFQNNLSIVTQSCKNDELYRDAQKYVFELLCSKLTNGTIPIVVEQLLYLGWIGLLVHTISTLGKNDKYALRLTGIIDLLLDIFDSDQDIQQINKTQIDYLLKVIKIGFSNYPVHTDDANQYITRLEEILESGGDKHPKLASSRVKFDQAHIKQLLEEQTSAALQEAATFSVEKNWLDLVSGIKLDDWIVEQRQLGHARMLNLAWKNPASTRYVFIDGEGKKRLDTEHYKLAQMFKQKHCSLLENGNLPIVERAVNKLLKNTFEQIKNDSDTDDLTSLLRRKAFQRSLTELLDITNDTGDQHVMLELDIDQFSVINELCGSKGGDRLLQTFSNIIRNYLPENAVLARIGDDEFGILIKNCSLDEGYHVAEMQRRALENLRYTWDGTAVPATASVGVVPIDASTRSAAEILNMASSARQLAIQNGGNCTRIYTPSDQDIEKQSRMTLAIPIIEDALKNNKLALFAQPIIPLFIEDDNEHHYEILLRIKNNDGVWESPEEFIQAAEKCNRMRSIDRWVINHIFTWLNNHHHEINNTGFSINLSAQTLDDETFSEFIGQQLNKLSFPSNKLTLEITETSLIKHIDKARVLIEEIKSKGCKFSLDDFGTGYSSYSYLKDFPVDNVKIDGVFIKDILTDTSSYAMVKSITEISHHMGKKVVAEYVESEAILVALRELEVDFAQGFSVGHPVPIKNLLQQTYY